MLTMDILLLPLQAYMCQTFISAGNNSGNFLNFKNNVFQNLKFREFGNFGTWELQVPGTWELGNLGTSELQVPGTWDLRNFGTWELRNLGTSELGSSLSGVPVNAQHKNKKLLQF